MIVEVFHGNEPMTQSLGETLKELRWIKQFSFEEIPHALNQGFGYDFALGKNYALWRELFLLRLIKDGIYQILKALVTVSEI